MAINYYLLVVADTIIGPGSTTEEQLPPGCIACTQTQTETWQTLEVVGGVIQAIPSAQLLTKAQAAQAAMLKTACKSAITGGFASSALGAANTYPSNLIDQHNLAGSVIASLLPNLPVGWTTNFWAMSSTGVWTFAPHTAAQIQQAGLDGKTWVTAQQTKLAGLLTQVQNATTVSAVQAVVYS